MLKPVNLPQIILIGCGKMGAALLKGWLQHKISDDICIVDPGIDRLNAHDGARYFKSLNDIPVIASDALFVLAVKPQILNQICQGLASVQDNGAVISIAAGKTTQNIATLCPGFQVIRAMPNTPAAIGEGITALYAQDNIDEDLKNQAERLFGCNGETLWVEHEDDFDAITALSGSGPAYIFYLMETLTKAGVAIGLNEGVAGKLARQTVIGAANLAKEKGDLSASTLRENVTSPGGTTEAALSVLMDGRIQELYNKALTKARDRGKELNKG